MKKNGLEFVENLCPDDGRIGYKMIGNLKEINDTIDRFWERRGQMLTSEFGLEPAGLARASNGLCDPYLSRIVSANPSYIKFFS